MSSIETSEKAIEKTEKNDSETIERNEPFYDPFDHYISQYNEYPKMGYDYIYSDQHQFPMQFMPPMNPVQTIPLMLPTDSTQSPIPPYLYSENSQFPMTDAPFPPLNYPQESPFPISETSIKNNYSPTQPENPQSEIQTQPPEISHLEIPNYDNQHQTQPIKPQQEIQPEKPQKQKPKQQIQQEQSQEPIPQPLPEQNSNLNNDNEKEKYISKLRSLLKNVNKNEYSIVEEKYIEWEIENWNELNNIEYSPEYTTGDNKWKFKLYPNRNNEEKNHISIYLENLNVKNDNLLRVFTNYVISMRNYKDFSENTAYDSALGYININQNTVGYDQYIEKSHLFNVNIETRKALVENNKTVIGAYIRVYKCISKDQYIEEIKSSISTNSDEIIEDDIYEWSIDHWNNLKNGEFSPEFVIGGYRWKLKLYPNGYNETLKDFVSIYLSSVDAQNNDTIHIYAKSIFYIRNNNDYACLKSFGEKLSPLNYTSKSYIWGAHHFIKKDDLFVKSHTTHQSLIENNKTVVGVYLRVFKYTKEKFINDIKRSINNENLVVLNEGYYEWKIEDWPNLKKEDLKSKFTLVGQRWELQLYPNGFSESFKNYVSLFMDNVDSLEDVSNHLCIKRVFYIRNMNDYSIYSSETSNITYYDKGCYSKGTGKLVKKTDLFSKKGLSNTSLIEDNKVVIGTYIRVFKYKEEQYLQEVCELIDDGNREIIDEDYFEWNIQDWEKLSYEILSPVFSVGGHKWRIKVYPHGNKQDGKNGYLTMALRNESMKDDKQYVYSNFAIVIRNTNDFSCFKSRELLSFRRFTKAENEFVMTRYTPKFFLHDPNNYYQRAIIENERATVGAFVRVYKNSIAKTYHRHHHHHHT
ncbi:hypothetical protein H8356DRAFT_1643584 [Neocallimastix lanati (nom. inval.)]|uniref:MATH domain-containing protein n=1 Tax=Neocallimastix californiae TaxID=1754190 RepID=A0A1Y2B612_9FUNG|nr:hypothetical protein H8356DRAFT_1643584 [Neocallimastix sp. JGI-2020a]ORY30279.1 hypothetical protein LY90DRAFT_705462 [Neocallimastix californiae]|eukprot:ORY30279.1 hypothetical protein LY90DRAFT_705462 [Neocallimastix californiae]